MPSPINATAISSSLAETLQRHLAARGVYWPSTTCEAIVAAQMDGIAAMAFEARMEAVAGGRRLRLVETERERI